MGQDGLNWLKMGNKKFSMTDRDIMIVCGFHKKDRKTIRTGKVKMESVIEVAGLSVVDLPVDTGLSVPHFAHWQKI